MCPVESDRGHRPLFQHHAARERERREADPRAGGRGQRSIPLLRRLAVLAGLRVNRRLTALAQLCLFGASKAASPLTMTSSALLTIRLSAAKYTPSSGGSP